MKGSIDMQKLRQKVHRDSQQDGITEMVMGLFFFFYAFVFDNLCKGVKTESPIFIFFVLFGIYPLVYFKLIRNSFTYPRMGYVEIKDEITFGFALTVILPLIILPIAMYLIIWVLSDLQGIASIVRWTSIAFGLTFGALYFSYAKRYGKKIYYVLLVISVIAGAVLSQVSLALTGASIVILLNGFILLVHGVCMLVRFIKRYPKPRNTPIEHKDDARE